MSAATIIISDEEESFDFTPPPKVSFDNIVAGLIQTDQDTENIIPETTIIMDGGSKDEQTTFINSQAGVALSSLEMTQVPKVPASKKIFSPLSSPGSLFDWFVPEPERASSAEEDEEEEEVCKENDTLASQESVISRKAKTRKRKHLYPLKPRKRIRIDDYETDSSSSSHESNISGEDSGHASRSLISEESSLTEDSNSVSTLSQTESSLSEDSNPDSALLSQDSDETIHSESSDSEYSPSESEVWDDENEIPDTQAVAFDFEVSDLLNQKDSSKNRSKGFQKNAGVKTQRNKKNNNRVSKTNNSSFTNNESFQQQPQSSQINSTTSIPPTIEDDGFEEVHSLKSMLIPIGDGYRLFLDNGKNENGETSYYCFTCNNNGKKTLAKICKLTKKTLVNKMHHENCDQEYENL